VRATTVALNYAETLFKLADKHGQLDAFAAALDELTLLLDGDPRVRTFLETPKIGVRPKQDALARALRGRVPPLFLNFVQLVIEKRRERLFADIARQFHMLLDEHLGRLHAQVTLARRPDEAGVQRIGAELTRALGLTVIPHIRVDEQILGGIIVRYGDHVLDGSLRRRLLSMRNRLRHAAVGASA
jgi:F-type H+-transporting ATPase subunit delta